MSTDRSDVEEDFRAQGIVVNSAHRMFSSIGLRRELRLILLKVKRDQDRICEIIRCLELVVRVEKQQDRTLPGQCYKCQRCGHS